MAVRISGSKTKETLADYFDVFDITAFRFAFLKRILAEYSDAVIMIDTNQRTAGFSVDSILTGLSIAGITPTVMRIQANSQNFFGLGIKKEQREKLIVFSIESGRLTRELFNSVSCCDLVVGIGAKRGLFDICDDLRLDGIAAHKELFEKSIYDSVLCGRIRCTFNARQYLKEIINEMGL